MHTTFLAELEPDPDGGFVVTFPDVPEVIAGGRDRAAALDEAAKALGAAMLFRAKDGTDLPAPSTKRGTPVSLPVLDALKLAVIDRFAASGMTKAQLAERLGKVESEARRILDPMHVTKADRLERALAVLGARATIEVSDLAA